MLSLNEVHVCNMKSKNEGVLKNRIGRVNPDPATVLYMLKMGR